MNNSILKKLLCVLLAAFMVLSVIGCNTEKNNAVNNDIANLDIDISGNIEGSATVERTYTTLYSENDAFMYDNPNRGFRGYIEIVDFDMTESELVGKMDNWMQRHVEYAYAQTAVCYIYPWQYRGKDLDDDFFKTVQWVFDYARERKIQLNLRFAYYHTTYCSDRTPTTDEIMLHLNQIAENGIVERNKDTIHAFQVGFVGRYGEWHSEDAETDRELIINSFMEKLLPEGVYGQVRMPQYKDLISNDNEKKSLVGFHMDSFFGIQDSSQYGSSTYSIGLSDWETNVKEGAYTPQDGELYFHGQFVNDYGFFPDGYACLLGMSQLRMTTFSSENGYLEAGLFGNSAMQQWQSQPVTEKWLKEYGIPYSENWLKNSNGETVERNVLEYIRDYLGYRFSATKLSTKADNNILSVSLALENHGFSAAFNITSQLVILDEKGNEVSSAAAGNPKDWHSTNPDNYKDRKQLTHNVTAQLKMPETNGKYSLALKLTSKNGTTARLDNNIPYENGYNILHTF